MRVSTYLSVGTNFLKATCLDLAVNRSVKLIGLNYFSRRNLKVQNPENLVLVGLPVVTPEEVG